jgi:hypothetical protein
VNLSPRGAPYMRRIHLRVCLRTTLDSCVYLSCVGETLRVSKANIGPLDWAEDRVPRWKLGI